MVLVVVVVLAPGRLTPYTWTLLAPALPGSLDNYSVASDDDGSGSETLSPRHVGYPGRFVGVADPLLTAFLQVLRGQVETTSQQIHRTRWMQIKMDAKIQKVVSIDW